MGGAILGIIGFLGFILITAIAIGVKDAIGADHESSFKQLTGWVIGFFVWVIGAAILGKILS